jgi:hypothetical protein
MSADYTDGYNDGYASAEGRTVRESTKLTARIGELERLLKAAARVVEAYGEDEGYTPSRVAEDYMALEKAGIL